MALSLILVIPVVAAVLTLGLQRLAPWLTLATTTGVLALAGCTAWQVGRTGPLTGPSGLLTLDSMSALYLLMVAFVATTAALYSMGYLEAHKPGQDHLQTPPRYRQYYPLFNLFLASMLAVPLVANLAIVWIAIELTTVLSAFLVAYEDRAAALEAAWKYVALTTMGAMIALLGVLLLYYGITAAGFQPTWRGLVAAAPHIPRAILLIAFVLWLVGFGAKAGLVPMHTWLPDAHSEAPASICALLSGVETSGALYMLLRIFPALVANTHIVNPQAWYLVFGIVSVAAASLLILQVRDFKRLFAYSTIEHMGIIIAACGLSASHDQVGTVYQFFAHSLTKSFCFYAAGMGALVLGSQRIADASGLMRRSPQAAWALLLGGVAIAGAPPFALFVSEFAILRAGFVSKQYLATGLLTAFIVLAFIAVMYQLTRVTLGGSEHDGPERPLPLSCKIALIVAFVPMFVFGFYLPAPLTDLVHGASDLLGAMP